MTSEDELPPAAPDLPWEPERHRTCLRGSVLVKLAAGEGPSHVPHYLDVARGRAPAAIRLDGGPVDSVLRQFTPAMQVTHAFHAARETTDAAARVRHWDDLEEGLGLSRTYRVGVDPNVSVLNLVDALGGLRVIEEVSPIYLAVTPFADPSAPGQLPDEPPADHLWAHRMVGVERALAFEPGDSALIVAVVDSGVTLDHPELVGRLRPGVDTVDLPPDRTSRGLSLIGDTRNPDRIPRDEMGHGTACASIISARGLRLPRGAGGEARILAARALAAAHLSERAAPTAVGGLADIDQAVKLAVDLGAKVLNLSFGTPETALRADDPRPHADMVKYAVARGCILVAASGNSGTPTRYFPAAHPGVLAVGSVDVKGRPSTFSTRGPHVALSAPGEKVAVAALDGYTVQSGTSFASPFVAGAAALLVARAARYGVPLDAAEVRRVLVETARPFGPGVAADGCGAGILDIPAALSRIENALAQPVVSTGHSLEAHA